MTYEAVLEQDDVPMTDHLEDVDLALEVLEEFGGELLPRHSFDGDGSSGLLWTCPRFEGAIIG